MHQTVPFDLGSEFLYYAFLSRQLNIKSYYFEQRSPWQKGAVENANRRIRILLPRSTDLEKISSDNLIAIADKMNNTSHKCLGYQTPILKLDWKGFSDDKCHNKKNEPAQHFIRSANEGAIPPQKKRSTRLDGERSAPVNTGLSPEHAHYLLEAMRA